MSHLVAYFGNEPENLACALFSARVALYSRSERGARSTDGFGLGFVQGGDVLLRKRPRAEATEVDLYGLVKDARAEALVGRVGLLPRRQHAAPRTPIRFASGRGCSAPSATSSEPAFEAIRERLLESTPDFLRRNIRGRSPSEHLFHLFLAFLHDAGILDQATPSPAVVQRRSPQQPRVRRSTARGDRSGPARSSRWWRRTGAASSPPAAATRSATSTIEGISDCPVCQAANDRSDGGRGGRRVPHEALRAVVLEANRARPDPPRLARRSRSSRAGGRARPDPARLGL